MDIKAGLVGAGAVVLLVAGGVTAASLANADDTPTTPAVVVVTPTVEPAKVAAPEPVVTPEPTPEPVVAPAPAPEVVVPEAPAPAPVVKAEPKVEEPTEPYVNPTPVTGPGNADPGSAPRNAPPVNG